MIAALVEANETVFVKWTIEESWSSKFFRLGSSNFVADLGSSYWAAFKDYRGN